MTNLLILSVGTRNKIVQYFVENLKEKGIVVAADCSSLAPALFEANKFYVIPRMTEEGYLEKVFEICRKENINGIFSLIDPELSMLARHQQEFEAMGVMVVGSSYEICERSLDKMEMYHWLISHGYNTAHSYTDIKLFLNDMHEGKINYPVFVKPIRGSASFAISKVENDRTIDVLFNHSTDMMIQEFMKGQEIGADVYIDLISGEVVSIFAKKKIKMRAGETDKAVSFIDEKLFKLIERFVTEAGYRGEIDIDIFEVDGVYYISEVNPRFGGGYPHAYACGANHIKLIINNLLGKKNKASIGQYNVGVYMMKYNEIAIL